jgi:hypothetical protein
MATDPMSVLGGMVGPGSAPAGPGAGMFSGSSALPPQVPTPSLPMPAAPAQPMVQPGILGMMQDVVTPSAPPADPPAIDKLRPGSDLHAFVLQQLDARLKFSRDKMKAHYARWNFNEQKVQAYAGLQDYERLVEGFKRKDATPPQPINIIVPYSYATIHAAATFVSSVLLGRKPLFPLLATRGTNTELARNMETALQSHIDASRGQETLWQGIWDAFCYGFGPTRLTWEERSGAAIKMVGGQRQQTTATTFSGNVITSIDPYAYFPDPRVPIHQCNIKGDFIFTEMDLSDMVLKDMEAAGVLKWVKEGLQAYGRGRMNGASTENRRRVRLGVGAEDMITPTSIVGFKPLKEGTVRIVPKDWKLGSSDQSELWKFSWFEGCQVMQAEPLNMIHNQHPYLASEPTSFGHDFMSLSMADMIGNFQDILSWLVSSRMENVRSVVQNSFVADPARIEINDVRSSAIGRIIRLKQTAMGTPIKEAIMQLVVQDVTMGHMADMQNMRILADTITGVNDNMRGIQSPGGRRSATEARISMQAGGGRLSQHAIRISSQAYHPMAEQMIFNIQQFMSDEMWVETTGDDGTPNSRALTPDMLVGSFNYQISDGSLPFDKTALVEVWKEILMGVAQDPELRAGHDINKIFDYVAELGGAKNIDSFKKQMQPQVTAGAQQDPAADPNLRPLGPAMPAGPMNASLFQG